jgi:exosortase A
VAAWAAVVLAILGLFHETAWSLLRVWMTSATYGHGLLILPIAAYLCWRRRRALAEVNVRPSTIGLAILAAAALAWLPAELAHVDVLRHLALVVMLQASVLAVFGWPVARILLFPLAYLLLAVPFGEFAVAPLQTLTAEYTVQLLRLSGIPVYMENWHLQIPGGAFLVAEACAGVRYLLACLALGFLFWDLLVRSWWRRLAILALAVMVPIAANVVRAYGIVMLAHLSDFQIAVDVDHVIYGGVFLSLVTLVLIALAFALRDHHPDDAPVESRQGPPAAGDAGAKALAATVAIAALVLLAVRATGAWAAIPPPGPHGAVLEVPERLGPWTRAPAEPDGWTGHFPGADEQGTWQFRDGDRRVTLFAAYFAYERPGAELVSSANSLLGDPANDLEFVTTVPAAPAAGLPHARALRIAGPGQPDGLAVWSWYLTSRGVTVDPLKTKLNLLTSKLLGRASSGLSVAIATPAGPEAQRTLGAFARHLNGLERIAVVPAGPAGPETGD